MGELDAGIAAKGDQRGWNKPITSQKTDRVILVGLLAVLLVVSIKLGLHDPWTGLGLGMTGLGILLPLAVHGGVVELKESTTFWAGTLIGLAGLLFTFFSVLASVS